MAGSLLLAFSTQGNCGNLSKFAHGRSARNEQEWGGKERGNRQRQATIAIGMRVPDCTLSMSV